MVEIDRGRMPVTRADINQTSFERKMRIYLSAYAAGQHKRQFGWKAFRVLTLTSDRHRMSSMMEASQGLHISRKPGSSIFLFATAEALRHSNPIAHQWEEGSGRPVELI